MEDPFLKEEGWKRQPIQQEMGTEDTELGIN